MLQPRAANVSAVSFGEILAYDPETGVFRWKVKLSIRSPIGLIAGCADKDDYIVIRIDKILYKAHKLAWYYMTGMMPSRIDHINMTPGDNAFANLRPATAVQNGGNCKKKANNTSGYKGVSLHRGKYTANIQCDGKHVYHACGQKTHVSLGRGMNARFDKEYSTIFDNIR